MINGYTRQELIRLIIFRALQKIASTITDLEVKASERVAMIHIENGHSACRAIEAGIKTGRELISDRSVTTIF